MEQTNRIIHLIKQYCTQLKLSLEGQVVLTELASGPYRYLPAIAAFAGAKKVIAYTKDSKYGNKKDIIEEGKIFFQKLNISDKIQIKTIISDQDFSEVTLVTNSGFLRPINDDFIQKLNPGILISLMYDAWELRDNEISIESCKKRNIKVIGTNENSKYFPIFSYCAPLILKMTLNAGYEILNNRILVWSCDDFGIQAKQAFENNGAKEVIMTTDLSILDRYVSTLDFIFICNYNQKSQYFKEGGCFDVSNFIKQNSAIGIIHLFGEIGIDVLKKNGIFYYPRREGKASQMTFTLADLSPLPLLKLQIASLKAAQSVIENSNNDLVQPINF
ncbi:hypothetical protein OAG30_00560 [Flavobacteriaceae bacterium]|nr:hypothetical protein [Flavobacteriaceae bacterium]